MWYIMITHIIDSLTYISAVFLHFHELFWTFQYILQNALYRDAYHIMKFLSLPALIHSLINIHLTDMCTACSCQIFGEAPDLSVPLPQAPSSRSTPRRSKAICLSSGKRKARLYSPALCLADNDSESFCNFMALFMCAFLLHNIYLTAVATSYCWD